MLSSRNTRAATVLTFCDLLGKDPRDPPDCTLAKQMLCIKTLIVTTVRSAMPVTLNTNYKRGSERPGSVILLSKNIYCTASTFKAAVGTARSLLGSPRNGQAALYLFQKTFTVPRVHL